MLEARRDDGLIVGGILSCVAQLVAVLETKERMDDVRSVFAVGGVDGGGFVPGLKHFLGDDNDRMNQQHAMAVLSQIGATESGLREIVRPGYDLLVERVLERMHRPDSRVEALHTLAGFFKPQYVISITPERQ